MDTPSVPEPNGSDRPLPRLSVLVFEPREAEAIALLDALDRQTLSPEAFEVRVVGSTPPPGDVGREPLAPRAYDLELIRAADSELAGMKALELCTAPVCLVLAAGGKPGPELCERHLALHEDEHGSQADRPSRAVVGSVDRSAGSGPIDALLREPEPLLALPGRERLQLDPCERFSAAHVSLPTEVLRGVGGAGRGWRSSRGADLDLARRLSGAGVELDFRPELVLPTQGVPDADQWLSGLVDLGRDLALLFRAQGDLGLLGRIEDCRDEPLWRPFQLAYETFRGRVPESVALLESMRSENGGKDVPAEMLGRLEGFVRSIESCALSRGLLWGLRGRDPSRVYTSGPERGPLTSLIVPSCDALDKTKECLEAVRRHREVGFPLEILFVDNGSTDGSREWLAAQDDVRLIANDENLGAPHARNQGLQLVRGEWIVFMDNDVIVTPGWLSRLRRHAEVDPFAACIGPVTDRAAHASQVPFDGGSPDERAAEIANEKDGAFKMTMLLSSFCLLVRREVIDLVGGFDERFSPWGFEDDDFTLRCGLAGFHNRIALDTFVQHKTYGGEKAVRHGELLERNWDRFASKWNLDRDNGRGDYTGLAEQIERSWDPEQLFVPFTGEASATEAAA
jgi:GT2 family glycosyltransferase